MPNAVFVQVAQILRAVLLLASALMVVKLWRTGLHRRYPVFFAFVIFRIPNSIWPFYVEITSDAYFYFWIITEPVAQIFYLLLVAELYQSVLERYKGLYTLGRWVMYSSVAIAITISALTLIPNINPTVPEHSRYMFYCIAVERGLETALALFIILILCFVSFFPLRLPRNVRVHALVFSIYFLSSTFVLLMRTLFGTTFSYAVNTTAVLGVSAASMIAWLTLLRSAGEDAQHVAAPLPPEQESRLLTQLDAINAALLKSGKRHNSQFSSTR
ncbi:MAG: hypothetical protein ABI759_32365 [Candidatus Solibacter sp.]